MLAMAPSLLFYSLPFLARSSSSIPFRKAAISRNQRHLQSRKSSPSAISSPLIATTGRDSEIELESRKFELLTAVNDTKRGLAATTDQRSAIEEALVRVESFDAGELIELDVLDGSWRLQYTSAPDVLVLFQSAETFPFLQVGQIFQKFECRDKKGEGIVRNVVRWSIQNVLEEHEGATLLVSAKFSVVSRRNIYLEFEENLSTLEIRKGRSQDMRQEEALPVEMSRAYGFLIKGINVQNIKISEELQALIAPAILPRTFMSLQILQFIRTFQVKVPVTSPQRRSVGGLYYLSYLDSNMLLGRAVGGGGVFIFTRAHASL